MNDFETTELIKIFKAFGFFRNNLPEEHNKFVKRQLQKNYDTLTKTFNLGGRIYTGTYREDSHRKDNKEAYAKESKLATVLASFGFDVILIEENNALPGKKPDAIVNGIVMDFKEIAAKTEFEATKNTLGKNYQKGMKKKNTEGVVLYLHNFSNEFVTQNMISKTSTEKNGLALFFHESDGTFQLLDMQKIRAAHLEQLQSRRTSSANTEHPNTFTIKQTEEMSNKKIRAAHKEQALVGTTPGTSSEHHTLDGFPTSGTVSSSSLVNDNSIGVEKSSKNNKSKIKKQKSADDDFGMGM